MATQNTPLLNLFGLQKMQQGAEGETGQRFYNRDTFKDLSANLAMGLNSMRLNPDASLPQRMSAQIANRKQDRTRNRTVEALRKKAEGGDKLAAKYLSAIESGALPVAQAMSAYMQEGAQLAAEGRAAARAAANRVTSRPMTAEEVAAAGLPPGGVYKINSLGDITVLSRAQAAKPATFKEFGGDLYRVEGNNLILQIEGKDDPTAPVFREFDGNLYRQEGNELVLVKEGTEKPKDPKNASLITLISKTPVTINGKTYAANVPFSLDQASQQAQIIEAARQGAIEAPTVTQTLTDPEDVQTVEEALAAASESPDAPEIDIAVGAGGDVGGKVVDIGNAVAGFFTGGSVSEEREKQVATINAANNSIKQPLVKALNKAGSNYTQKTINLILPTPNLTNEKFIQRAEALFPTLGAELGQQLVAAQSAKDPAARTSAKNQADAISTYIASMSNAIAVYRRSNSGGRLQDQADAILGGGN
jgi:prefoldin subunit 5